VRAFVRDGRIRIDVEDDGVGLPEGWTMAASGGTGLRNLASRLAAEFGDQAALAVSPRHSGGVLASITLPFVRA
jgi:LytS/YehU family sensor histidine kinase